MTFYEPPLTATATATVQTVDTANRITTGHTIVATATHLIVFALGLVLVRVLRVPRVLFFVGVLIVHLLIRATVFLVSGVHLHRNFQLFLTVVRPVLLIEDNRLQIMPFRVSFVAIVQNRLCLRNIPFL